MIMHKSETLAQLKVKLVEAKAVDERSLAAHREQVAAQVIKRREFLAELRKCRSDQQFAKFALHWPGTGGCPRSMAAEVQAQIDMLELIAEETFKTTVNGNLMGVLRRNYGARTVC
jgi:hypothetical protein